MLARAKGVRVCLDLSLSSISFQLVKFFLCLAQFDSKSLLAYALKLLHCVISIVIGKYKIFFNLGTFCYFFKELKL